jgi:cytochrome c oxidase subunit II
MSRSSRAARRACHSRRRRRRLGLRIAAFVIVSIAAVFAAAALLVPRTGIAGPADATITVTMGGFSTPVLEATADQPLRLKIVNPDTPYHSDGGGWHQLAIPTLGVDAQVAPRSQSVVEIPAAAPGEYAFYCDVCCGGKENPSMQGTLRVTA